MTASELKSIIDDQRSSNEGHETMRRDALPNVRFHPDFATIVKGIRRCGKSTLTEQWRRGTDAPVLALNFDDLRMMSFGTDDFRVLDRVVAESRATHLIFDEIHSVEGWELYIRQKLDQGHRVLVTGSNATLLSRELGTKLSGRHLDLELFPFSYPEFLRFRGRERGEASLRDYLRDGGFPAYLKTGEPTVLKELVGDIIYKDIAVRYGIRDVQPLRDLCLFLLGATGNRVSPSRLREAMRVKSATTMLEYFNYFENSYLVNRISAYSPSTKARLLAPKKVYLADPALAGLTGAAQSPNLGHILENVVYLHLRRLASEVYYLDDEGRECDFIVRNAAGRYSAVQVCWELNDENRKREFSGLVVALRRFGLASGTIVTANQADYAVEDGLDIEIVPAFEYLTR
ncbi:MAG: ATP-binding protein [Kiritimatiellia bacterium]